MQYKSILLHIPHSSLYIPDNIFFNKNILIDNMIKYTDVFTDEIFKLNYSIDRPHETIKFEFNRFYCDVERYWEDDKEPMSKYGQGVYYTKFNDNTLINRNDSKDTIKMIYDNHHEKLNDLSNYLTKQYGNCLIIDCHSFNDNIATNSPDICIGINNNEYDVNESVLNNIIMGFEKNNYSTKINYPYTGSILPNKLNDNNINTVMLEINKKCYMNNHYLVDIEKLVRLNNLINEIIDKI